MNALARPAATIGIITAAIRDLSGRGFLRLAVLASVGLALLPFMAFEIAICMTRHSRKLTLARWLHWLAWCACKITGIQVYILGDRPEIEVNLYHRGVSLGSRLALAAASPNVGTDSPVSVPVTLEFCETLTKSLDLDQPSIASDVAAILNGPGGEVVVMFGVPVRGAASGKLSDRQNALSDIGGLLRHYA